MFRIRSKFYKKEDMVFISHLDLIRLLERAFRRAEIPISYTRGFNPRPIMAFATALGIGISSDGEYMDIEISKKIELDKFINSLNNQLPDGLQIVAAKYIPMKEGSLMAGVNYSSYLVKTNLLDRIEYKEIENKIKNFLNLDEIIAIRQRKRGRRKRRGFSRINIRNQIKYIKLLKLVDKVLTLEMLLSTGSRGNLKPEIVIKKLEEEMNIPIKQNDTRVHRIELFNQIEPRTLTPLEDLNN